MNPNPLAERAMLTGLSIKRWSPVKKDEKVTREVADMKGADHAAAGTYQKNLISRSALRDLTKVCGEARTYHYKHTLPWLDDGRRILTAKAHLIYVAEMQKFQQRFNRLAADLADNFPGYVAAARTTLGKMFDPKDYPTPADILAKHVFGVKIDPIPDADDFRVKLPEAELTRLRREIHERTEIAMAEANRDMWQRVAEIVGHMADKLADPDGKFKDTLVTNVSELADIIGDLNVAEDPELYEMAGELKEKVAGLDPELLRKDHGLRSAAARTAEDITAKAMGRMKGYLRKGAAA